MTESQILDTTKGGQFKSDPKDQNSKKIVSAGAILFSVRRSYFHTQFDIIVYIYVYVLWERENVYRHIYVCETYIYT